MVLLQFKAVHVAYRRARIVYLALSIALCVISTLSSYSLGTLNIAQAGGVYVASASYGVLNVGNVTLSYIRLNVNYAAKILGLNPAKLNNTCVIPPNLANVNLMALKMCNRAIESSVLPPGLVVAIGNVSNTGTVIIEPMDPLNYSAYVALSSVRGLIANAYISSIALSLISAVSASIGLIGYVKDSFRRLSVILNDADALKYSLIYLLAVASTPFASAALLLNIIRGIKLNLGYVLVLRASVSPAAFAIPLALIDSVIALMVVYVWLTC